MPRNLNNPRKSLSVDKKLEKKKANLTETGASEGNIKLVNRFINTQIRDGKSKVSSLTYLRACLKIQPDLTIGIGLHI